MRRKVWQLRFPVVARIMMLREAPMAGLGAPHRGSGCGEQSPEWAESGLHKLVLRAQRKSWAARELQAQITKHIIPANRNASVYMKDEVPAGATKRGGHSRNGQPTTRLLNLPLRLCVMPGIRHERLLPGIPQLPLEHRLRITEATSFGTPRRYGRLPVAVRSTCFKTSLECPCWHGNGEQVTQTTDIIYI